MRGLGRVGYRCYDLAVGKAVVSEKARWCWVSSGARWPPLSRTSRTAGSGRASAGEGDRGDVVRPAVHDQHQARTWLSRAAQSNRWWHRTGPSSQNGVDCGDRAARAGLLPASRPAPATGPRRHAGWSRSAPAGPPAGPIQRQRYRDPPAHRSCRPAAPGPAQRGNHETSPAERHPGNDYPAFVATLRQRINQIGAPARPIPDHQTARRTAAMRAVMITWADHAV